MKIQILCDKCNTPLTDAFGCENAKIAHGKTQFGNMECLKCERLFTVQVSVVIGDA